MAIKKYKSFVNHSMTFYVEGETGKHTWDDWRIVPTTRPVIIPPTPKYNYVLIPGSSAVVDLTEYISGGVTYNPREGQLEFLVQKKEQWSFVYEEIMNYLQGHRVRVVLDDDPEYYYEGRCAVSTWTSSELYSTITLDYYFLPYKYPVNYSLDSWTYSASEERTGVL